MRILNGVDDSERWPIAHGRVRMVQVGLNTNHRFALCVVAVQHALPTFQLFGGWKAAAWARFALNSYLPEFVGDASAHISVPVTQEPLGILVVNWQPVALDVLFIDFASEP